MHLPLNGHAEIFVKFSQNNNRYCSSRICKFNYKKNATTRKKTSKVYANLTICGYFIQPQTTQNNFLNMEFNLSFYKCALMGQIKMESINSEMQLVFLAS